MRERACRQGTRVVTALLKERSQRAMVLQDCCRVDMHARLIRCRDDTILLCVARDDIAQRAATMMDATHASAARTLRPGFATRTIC